MATTPSFDFESLTMREVSLIEELSGQSISAIADETTPKGKALAALAMVAKRRSGFPSFTFNEASAMTLAEVNELLGTSDDEDDEADADPEGGDALGEAEPPFELSEPE